IKKYLGVNKKVGIIGNVKYSDINLLAPKKIIDLTKAVSTLISFKSNSFIYKIHVLTKFNAELLKSLKITAGEKQTDIAKDLEIEAIANDSKVYFVCIT